VLDGRIQNVEMSSARGEGKIKFPCGDLTLEGVLHLPDGSEPFPAVVVCHPHPLYGGAMDDFVVMAVCRALLQESIAAFRFNFRGVGESDGLHGKGVGEQEDVKAAVSYLCSRQEVDATRIGLAGYSFGAGIALSVAPQEERIQALAAVSPALTAAFPSLKNYVKPKFLVVGSADTFIPSERFLRLVGELAEPKEHHVVPGADHFWLGYEDVMVKSVASFFSRIFKEPARDGSKSYKEARGS